MQYSREVEEMFCVAKGAKHDPAPIPEEGKWVKAKEITLEGAGTLYERYLALKQELEDMGMFAQEYKQPIPAFRILERKTCI